MHVSLVPRDREERERKREEGRERGKGTNVCTLSSPLIVLDLINTFAEYGEKCY